MTAPFLAPRQGPSGPFRPRRLPRTVASAEPADELALARVELDSLRNLAAEAEDAAYRRGYQEGAAAARDGIEALGAAAIAALAPKVSAALDGWDALQAQLQRDAAMLALAAARHMAGEALAAEAAPLAALDAALKLIGERPRLALTVPAALRETVAARLPGVDVEAGQPDEQGFAIAWDGGGCTSEPAARRAEIETLFAGFLAPPSYNRPE